MADGERNPENETPREACANLAMEFRALADREQTDIRRSEVWGWVARLERAVQRMDQEKASQRP